MGLLRAGRSLAVGSLSGRTGRGLLVQLSGGAEGRGEASYPVWLGGRNGLESGEGRELSKAEGGGLVSYAWVESDLLSTFPTASLPPVRALEWVL